MKLGYSRGALVDLEEIFSYTRKIIPMPLRDLLHGSKPQLRGLPVRRTLERPRENRAFVVFRLAIT